MKNITIIVASSGENKKLAEKISHSLKIRNYTHRTLLLDELKWPLYSSQEEKITNPVSLVSPYKDFLAADSFIILAPEYNGGTPPVLTNFFAWVSRTEKDWRKFFNQKSTLIGTHSGNGMYILPMLRIQLSHMGMNVLSRQIHSSMSKQLKEEELQAILETFYHSF